MSDVVTRRNLPHWYRPGYAHFITYRVVGSIPQNWLKKWQHDRKLEVDRRLPEDQTLSQHRTTIHRRFFALYDQYLDQQSEHHELSDEVVAAMVRENLYHHNDEKYELLAYCIMSNHVHVVLQPLDEKLNIGSQSCVNAVISDEQPDSESPLSRIMHSLKSYTANRANEILGRTGQFWQHESYDHWVRDEDELQRIVDYVCWNPVKAQLAGRPHEWRFSSAYDRFKQDGDESGILGGLRDDWRSADR